MKIKPLPQNGHITPPEAPGWGAEWDWAYFKKKRLAELKFVTARPETNRG